MLCDFVLIRLELGHERRIVVKAHHVRHAQLVFRRARQVVRLCVFDVLQTVLQLAQEAVSLGQPRHGVGVDQAALRRRPQHLQRGAHAQPEILPAANELKHLRDEFNLADAAAPELDVGRARLQMAHVVALLVGTVAALGCLVADLRMQRANGGDHAVIEIATKHKRARHAIQLLDHAGCMRTGRVSDDATLDPGVALPLPALHDEVLLQHAQTARQRPRIAIRAKTHVDAEDVAVLRHIGQRVDQPPAELREVFMIGERARAALGVAIVVVEEDQIDVGRDVQLAPAQLAHAHHQQFLHLAGGLTDRLAVQRGQFLSDYRKGRAHSKLGQVRHRARHLVERCGAGQIALNQCAEDFIAQQAQGALERRLSLHGPGIEQFSEARQQPRHVNGMACASLHTLGPSFARLRLAL